MIRSCFTGVDSSKNCTLTFRHALIPVYPIAINSISTHPWTPVRNMAFIMISSFLLSSLQFITRSCPFCYQSTSQICPLCSISTAITRSTGRANIYPSQKKELLPLGRCWGSSPAPFCSVQGLVFQALHDSPGPQPKPCGTVVIISSLFCPHTISSPSNSFYRQRDYFYIANLVT